MDNDSPSRVSVNFANISSDTAAEPKTRELPKGLFGLKPDPNNKYLYAAMALTLINLAYWTFFQINAYNTFHLSTETALSALSFYYLTHFSNLLHGFQFLVMATHIAPDQLLLTPLFYLFPSALTLMIAKVVILCLSGLLVFFVARDLLKNHKFALALTFAYFFATGTINMQLNEYHVEILIVPLYLLTFYFCMKRERKWFYVSLLLLLGVFESVLSIVGCLGLGILAYEYFYDKDPARKKEIMRLGVMIVVCTLLALLFYNFVYYQVQSTSSATLPPDLALPPYPFVPLFNSASYNYPSGFRQFEIPYYFVYAMSVALVDFGVIAIFAPASILLFIAPWIGGVFILQNTLFFYAWRNAYVIPGAVAGAILGYEVLMRIRPKAPAAEIIVLSTILISAILVLPLFNQPLFNPNSEMFLFQFNQSEINGYEQLRSAISLIPNNASLMTQLNLYPYLQTGDTSRCS
jgi:uncharacterized membrane protein